MTYTALSPRVLAATRTDEAQRLIECRDILASAHRSCRVVGLVTLADSLSGVIAHIDHVLASYAVVGRVAGRQ